MFIDQSLLPFHVHLLVSRYCWMKRPRPTERVHARATGCHVNIWLVPYKSGLGVVCLSDFSGTAFAIGGPRTGCNRDNRLISIHMHRNRSISEALLIGERKKPDDPEWKLRLLNHLVNLAPPECDVTPLKGHVDYCCDTVEYNWGLEDSLLVTPKPSPTVQPQYPHMGRG